VRSGFSRRRVERSFYLEFAPCSLAEIYRRFRGTRCFHRLIAIMVEAANTCERLVNSYQDGVTSQNTAIFKLMLFCITHCCSVQTNKNTNTTACTAIHVRYSIVKLTSEFPVVVVLFKVINLIHFQVSRGQDRLL
jgi:hypothetical protein